MPTATKPRVVKKPQPKATPEADPTRELVDLFLGMIKDKSLDPYLSEIGHTLDLRVATHENEKKAAAKKGTAGTLKSAAEVPAPARTKGETIAKPPTKKTVSASEKPVTVGKLEPNKNYKIKSAVRKVGGATVTFVRFYKGDESKAVVKMVTDKPEYPKGKTFPIPVSTLEPLRSATNHRKSTTK